MISDGERVRKIRKRLNTHGRVDVTDVEFLIDVLVRRTAVIYWQPHTDYDKALKIAKEYWGEA